MDIKVLGIDLGKTVCSLAELVERIQAAALVTTGRMVEGPQPSPRRVG
jgi:hypothetical protein